MKTISFIFGTRPEAIKLSPLILTMQQEGRFKPHVCVTGQHRHMLDQVLEIFGVHPDVDLDLMQSNQSLAGLTSRAMAELDDYLVEHRPDLVVIQGDTTTVFCAALAAFYRHIPVAHVEAGLRTWDKRSPFPEEANRTMTTILADLHFAPTEWSRGNLLKEGVAAEKVLVTGNTVIDALLIALDKVKASPPSVPGLPPELMKPCINRPLVLITGHRRENFGTGFDNICQAISQLSERFPEVAFVYPVHLNPNVQKPVFDLLSGHKNIYLIEPLGYLPFVALMNRSTLILTDSGGVQEEAPSLAKPVLVMRDTTERPEAVETGSIRLVGTSVSAIIDNVTALLTDRCQYHAMSNCANPYGDGNASGRILTACAKFLNLS